MTEIGYYITLIALFLCAYCGIALIIGIKRRRVEVIASAENSAMAVFVFLTLAATAMIYALVTKNFQIEYIARYTDRNLSLLYTLTAFYAGQEGSLLFWSWILSLFTAVVIIQNKNKNRELMPYVTATCMTVAAFFTSLLIFLTPPFAQLAFVPAEGTDLNPLLQNYWMSIHPPSLYLGYVSWTIPFGFAMAALATGRLDDLWIRTSRKWSLAAWFFLSLGNLFGARWAYEVLGWGGYWAWDPVENAAFMPWLTGTAYLHSVMIQERKDMLKVWNLCLIILTFALTIFGTFLTRSGVISSVHSFTQSGLGPYFLGFLAVVIAGSVFLLVSRLRDLRPSHRLDSVVSRESAFLFNNLILLGIAFATFWGTVFPVLSEWVRGVKITVGPPFFNRVNAPLAIMLLFLMGAGPIVAWRRATVKKLIATFAVPTGVGIAAGLAVVALGMHSIHAVLVTSLSAFVLETIFHEFHRGARARTAMTGESYAAALANLVRKNRRRYGGYVIHFGVVLMFIGVTMSSVYRVEELHTVKPGESFEVGDFVLRYEGVSDLSDEHIARLAARLSVAKNGVAVGELTPEKRFYRRPEQPATEVDYRSTLSEDLYVILGSVADDGVTATFQTYINPLVAWLWIGGIVLILGTGICVFPGGERVAAARRAKSTVQARDVGDAV